jgi:hypothetical protein
MNSRAQFSFRPVLHGAHFIFFLFHPTATQLVAHSSTPGGHPIPWSRRAAATNSGRHHYTEPPGHPPTPRRRDDHATTSVPLINRCPVDSPPPSLQLRNIHIENPSPAATLPPDRPPPLLPEPIKGVGTPTVSPRFHFCS